MDTTTQELAVASVATALTVQTDQVLRSALEIALHTGGQPLQITVDNYPTVEFATVIITTPDCPVPMVLYLKRHRLAAEALMFEALAAALRDALQSDEQLTVQVCAAPNHS